jgi:hypothetical protein
LETLPSNETFLYVLLPYLPESDIPPCWGGVLPSETNIVVAVFNGTTYELYSDAAPSQLLSADITHISYDGTQFQFNNNGGQVCASRDGSEGYFALFYSPLDDYATGIPWPKANPDSVMDLQGMTGTCHCSVNPDAAQHVGLCN